MRTSGKERGRHTPTPIPGIVGRRSRSFPMTREGKQKNDIADLLLIFLPLLTLLISFHPWLSPALAVGESPPRFDWPLRGRVSMPFRPPTGPYWEGGHAGLDIEAPRGSEVRASAFGVVAFAGFTPLGLCVSIDHQMGFRSTYVSLKRIYVKKGDKVERGQVIALSDGSMDRSSSSPHLHFGLYLNGKPVDPFPYLSDVDPDPGKCLFLGPCQEDSGRVGVSSSDSQESNPSSTPGREIVNGEISTYRIGDSGGRDERGIWDRATDSVKRFFRERLVGIFMSAGKGISAGVRSLLSNSYVKGALAGLLAALVVCSLVVAGGLAMGMSVVALSVACLAGGLASLGYSVYLAGARGGGISFWGCFVSGLILGLSVGGSVLLLGQLTPILSSGFVSLGSMGFIKSFMAHGASGCLAHWLTSHINGEPLDLRWALLLFLTFGATGSLGKALINGLSLANPYLTTGVRALTGKGLVVVAPYVLGGGLHKVLSLVLLSGCFGVLSDISINLALGTFPSTEEVALSFLGGCLAGAIGITVKLRFSGRLGGRKGIFARLSKSDFVKGFTGKGLGGTAREMSRKWARTKRGAESGSSADPNPFVFRGTFE